MKQPEMEADSVPGRPQTDLGLIIDGMGGDACVHPMMK
jgi:hypothetical protein